MARRETRSIGRAVDRRRNRTGRRGGAPPRVAWLLGTLLLAGPAAASAQACTPADADEGPTPASVDEVEPPFGPPGTTVRVRDRDLPVRATVHLAIGQVGGGGYQVGDPLETDPRGVLEGTVAVPDWAESDRAVFVMVFSEQFRPMAFSGPFHVTDPDGRVRRSGTVVRLDGGCLGLEGDDATYALVGEAAQVLASREGADVTVEARPETGSCGCADVLRVERIVSGGDER